MIRQVTTRKIDIISPLSCPLEQRQVQAMIGDTSHIFQCDGQVDQFVQGLEFTKQCVQDVAELGPFLADSKGQLAKARTLIDQGAQTVTVDGPKGGRWTASSGPNQSLMVCAPDEVIGSPQRLYLFDDQVVLQTNRRAFSSEQPTLEHRIFLDLGPTGPIVERETLEISQCQWGNLIGT